MMKEPVTDRPKIPFLAPCLVAAALGLVLAPGPATTATEEPSPTVAYAAVDFAPVPGATAANRERLSRLITTVARRGAQYVVLPELGLTGSLAGLDEAAAAALAEPLPGPTTERFAALSRHLGVWITFSLLERGGDGDYLQPGTEEGLYLTTVLLDDDGEIRDTYRKILVRSGEEDGPADRGSYRAILDTIDHEGLRLGILSGDDIQVGVPRLANRGAETILVTAGWSADDPTPWWELCHELSEKFAVNLVVANRRPGGAVAVSAAPETPAAGGLYTARGVTLSAARAAGAGPLVGFLPRRELPWEIDSAVGLPRSVPVPAYQPPNPRIAELGRLLFVDTNLSATKDVSCSSCHRPRLSFTNGEPRGEGVYGRHTKRNVASLLNVAFKPLLRWDGYASMLENFVKYPISGYSEMSFHYLDEVVAYVRSSSTYTEAFRDSMGVETIEFEHIARALATYQRTLVSGDSPFDRYYFRGDEDALSASARRGLDLFVGKADCARCHQIGDEYALFMNFDYHFLGVGYEPDPGASEDIGLGSISTNDLAGYFQTPSLRNVAETAPYMHDGSMETLEEVVDFFDRGGDPVPGRTIDLKPLGLTEPEKRDLIAFLRSLTGVQRYDEEGRRLHPPAERPVLVAH